MIFDVIINYYLIFLYDVIFMNLGGSLACEENRIDEAKLLINFGGRLNIKNKQEKTPIDLAPEKTQTVLKKLVKDD